MARFGRRRRREPAQPAPRDPDFPFLTIDDAARLRALTRDAFAELGVETSIHGTYLEAADGQRYGLRNLFAACHHAGKSDRAWSRAVREHVARLLAARDQPTPAELDRDELLEHAVVRICQAEALAPAEKYTYCRPLGGGMVEALAFDTPSTVTYLTDDDVERVGLDDLRAAGLEHLIAEPFGTVHDVAAPDGGAFSVLAGDSVYTASRLLALDDVIRRVHGEADAPNGVLVSVPHRHQLAFHLPEDKTVIPVIGAMTKFTLTGYHEMVGPVSPHVFWRPPGGGPLEQLTTIDQETVTVRVQGAFAEVLEKLLGSHPDL